jgi:uncharacterized membrane protein YedE/YeeE
MVCSGFSGADPMARRYSRSRIRVNARPVDALVHHAASQDVAARGVPLTAGRPGPSLRVLGELLVSFVAGFVFAAGLVMAGMTQPARVIGFLDIRGMFAGAFPGHWDPSLGFVMGGAVMVTLVAFATTPYASVRPWFARAFVLPRRESVSARLVIGAVLFGIGWGLSGYCPGPAMASLLTGQIDTVVFVMAMLPGMWLARKV